MFGDPDRLRGLARDLDRRGEELGHCATSVVARAHTVRWESDAADAMRERAAECAHRLRRVAASCEEAADAVRLHATSVDGAWDLVRLGQAGPWEALQLLLKARS